MSDPERPQPAPRPERSDRQARRGRDDPPADRNLRSLVSSRPTQLSPTLAMRAREVATPSAEDLVAADQDLVLIRRNYVPPSPLSTLGRARRSPGHGGRAERGRRQDGSSGAAGADS